LTLELVDLHTHVLPGIDDGPRGLDESIATMRAAHAAGARRVVATPHMFLEPWNHRDPERVRAAFAAMLENLAAHAKSDPECAFLSDLQLDLGAENYASPEFLGALRQGGVLTLAGGRHLLIEFPLFLPAATFLNLARQVLDAGYWPVIAHVERYGAFAERPAELDRLRELGCKLQVNAQSVMGAKRDALRRRCLDWIEAGPVEIVASDVHGPSLVRAHLGEALPALRARLSQATVAACVALTPTKVLES
jgi:protein-tyrosine phosphatase